MGPAREGLYANDFVCREIDLRLKDKMEFAGGDSLAQIDLEGAPRLHLHIHFRIEEAQCAATLRLCSIERDVRAFHELVAGGAVLGRDRDPDADARIDLLSVDDEGIDRRVDQTARKSFRILRVGGRM